ncbi:hypothetical protein GTQ34_13275 [Muricauda sp. JGD-17]|uniref:EF-hand domain-containing protein n=1 Tax=Flagellimonas ochracea TaxID=2696472 RepID=A0A964WYJ6_9FLAO|nr:hypothetical protein [Allomuricauda ochracea]NAY92888.1 hypothetical protein [Allomuricauda ochracea]
MIGVFAIVIVLLVRKKIQNAYIVVFYRSALLAFVMYVLILTSVEIRWHYITRHAQSFDLNGNGFVDLNEYTDEALAALNKATQDTSRTFAFVTVAIFSGLVSFAFLLTDIAVNPLKNKKTRNPYE